MITVNFCDLFHHRPVTSVHTPKAIWVALVKTEETYEQGTNTTKNTRLFREWQTVQRD